MQYPVNKVKVYCITLSSKRLHSNNVGLTCTRRLSLNFISKPFLRVFFYKNRDLVIEPVQKVISNNAGRLNILADSKNSRIQLSFII